MTSFKPDQAVVQSSEDAAFFGDGDPRIAYNRVWFNLMRVHRNLHPKIAKSLRKEGISDPIWYEILLEVEQAGEAGHLMSALEEKLFVPQYALSRHVARLEAAGYLRRQTIADGRRKQVLFLTEEGTGIHSRIWPIYMNAIQSEIADTMPTDEAYRLARALIRFLP